MSVPNNPSKQISTDSKYNADKGNVESENSKPTAIPAKPKEGKKLNLPSPTEATDAVYAIYQDLYGIKISEQDKKNRAALEWRLANFEGVPEPTKVFLKEKLTPQIYRETTIAKLSDIHAIKPNTVSTQAAASKANAPAKEGDSKLREEQARLMFVPEEIMFIRKMCSEIKLQLKLQQTLKDDEMQKVIQEGCLLSASLKEEIEKKEKNDGGDDSKLNTETIQIDTLLFKLEFEDSNSDQTSFETNHILVDYTTLSQSKDNPLLGLWMDDIDFKRKCETQRKSPCFRFFDTDYWVEYQYLDHDYNTKTQASHRMTIDNQTTQKNEDIRYCRIHHFKNSNAEITKLIETREECILTQTDLPVVLCFRFIEWLRRWSPEAWTKFMQADFKTWQDMFLLFLGEGNCLYQPSFFRIDQQGVQVYQRDRKKGREDCNDNDNSKKTLLHTLFQDTLQGKTGKVLQKLDESSLDLDTAHLTFEITHDKDGVETQKLNILSAAIYACQTDLAEKLFKRWITRGKTSCNSREHIQILKMAIENAFDLSNTDKLLAVLKTIQQDTNPHHSNVDVKGSAELSQQIIPNAHARQNCSLAILELLLHYISRFRQNPNIQISLLDSRDSDSYDQDNHDGPKFLSEFDWSYFVRLILVNKVQPKILLKIFPFFSKQLYSQSYRNRKNPIFFFLGVYLGSISLLNEMLHVDADIINQPLYLDRYGDDDDEDTVQIIKQAMPCLLPGMTPLMLAVALYNTYNTELDKSNALLMVEFLSSNPKININAELIPRESSFGTINDKHAHYIIEQEGFTALMFAVEAGQIQLIGPLLANKAQVFHYAFNGLHAISLAEKLEFSDTRDHLNSHVKSSALAALPMPETIQSFLKYPHKMQLQVTSLIFRKAGLREVSSIMGREILHSFSSIMTRHFSLDKLTAYLHTLYRGANLNPNHYSLQKFGTLYCSDPINHCHYTNEFLILEVHDPDLIAHMQKIENPKPEKEFSKKRSHFKKTETEQTNPKKDNDKSEAEQITVKKALVPKDKSRLSSFHNHIRRILLEMQSVRALNPTEVTELNQAFTACIEKQARIMDFIQRGDSQKCKQLLQSTSKEDLDISIPIFKKGQTSNGIVSHAAPKDIVQRCLNQENSDKIALSDIIQSFIKMDAEIESGLNYIDLLQIRLAQSFNYFTVYQFNEFITGKIQNISQFKNCLKLILDYDREDLLETDVFKDYVGKFYADTYSINKAGILNHLLQLAMDHCAFKIMTALSKKLDNKVAIKAILKLVLSRPHSDTINTHTLKIIELIELLIRLSSIDRKELLTLFKEIQSLPLLKIVLTIPNCRLDKKEIDEKEKQELLEAWCNRAIDFTFRFRTDIPGLDMLNYLIREYASNEILDKQFLEATDCFRDYESGIDRLACFRLLLPRTSQETKKEAWMTFFQNYRYSYVREDEIKEITRKIEEFLESFALEAEKYKKNLSLTFQIEAREINAALHVAVILKNLDLFKRIQDLTTIKPEDEQHYDFYRSCNFDVDKIAFATSLLNTLIDDSAGNQTLAFAWLLNSPSRCPKGFLDSYFHDHYPKIAEPLASIEAAIRKDEPKTLDEILQRTKVKPNTSLFIYEPNNNPSVKRMTPMEFAMHRRRYQCMEILLRHGVIVNGQEQVKGEKFGNHLSSDLLDDIVGNDHLEVLRLIHDNNRNIPVLWTCYERFESVLKHDKKRTVLFLKSLYDRLGLFCKKVDENDADAIQEMAHKTPEYIFIDCLKKLIKKFQDYDQTSSVVRPFKQTLDASTCQIITTLFMHLHPTNKVNLEYNLLLDTLKLIRKYSGSAAASQLAIISRLPCMRSYALIFWMDGMVHLDFKQLKILTEIHEENWIVMPQKNRDHAACDPEINPHDPFGLEVWQTKIVIYPSFGERNALVLFLGFYSNINLRFQDLGHIKDYNLVSQYFISLLNAYSYQYIKEHASNLQSIIAGCPNETLGKHLNEALNRFLPAAISAERHWARAAALLSFLRANRTNKLKNCIVDLLPEILKAADYPLKTADGKDLPLMPLWNQYSNVGAGQQKLTRTGLLDSQFARNVVSSSIAVSPTAPSMIDSRPPTLPSSVTTSPARSSRISIRSFTSTTSNPSSGHFKTSSSITMNRIEPVVPNTQATHHPSAATITTAASASILPAFTASSRTTTAATATTRTAATASTSLSSITLT